MVCNNICGYNCPLHDDVLFDHLPVVYRDVETAAVLDGLRQVEAVDDDMHVPLVRRFMHLAGDVEAFARVRAVGVLLAVVHDDVERHAVRGGVLLMVAEGVEPAGDGGDAVRNGLERYRDALRAERLVAEEQGGGHAREGAAHLRGVLQVLDVAHLVGVGAYQLVGIEGDDLLGAHRRLAVPHVLLAERDTDVADARIGNLHLGSRAAPHHVGRDDGPLVLRPCGTRRVARPVAVDGLQHVALTGVSPVGVETVGAVEQHRLGVVIVAHHPVGAHP